MEECKVRLSCSLNDSCWWLIIGIGKIPHKKDAGPEEVLVFRHYNANEVWFVNPVPLCIAT